MVKSSEELEMPVTLGACADFLYDVREERLRLQKLVDIQAEKETKIKDHIIRNLSDTEGGAVGLRYKAMKVRKSKPVVKDWVAFWKYVFRNKGSEFLQKRVSEGAIQERWDAGKVVPGVEAFQYIEISLTKV